MRAAIRVIFPAAWIAVVSVISCGNVTVGPDSTAVGAACTTDMQCEQQCLVGDRHFPGGMCTLSCATDASCPAGSRCINEQGGLCAVGCTVDADCTAFGRGYVCEQEARPDGTEAAICRVP